jgi:hypothetical protein
VLKILSITEKEIDKSIREKKRKHLYNNNNALVGRRG